MASVRIKDLWAEQRLFTSRVVAAVAFIALLSTVVVTRLVDLQIVQYERFSAQSQGNRIRIEPVAPTRGLILDRHGRVLAENQASFNLELVPEQVPDLEATLQRLTDLRLLEVEDLPDIRRDIAARRRFDAITIRRHLSDEELARFASNRPFFEGVDIQARLSRHYPHGPALAHVLGYVGGISADDQRNIDAVAYAGTTYIGKAAVEKAFEHELHGKVGRQQVLVNARGRSLQTLDRQGARPGSDLVLGLDLDAQLAGYAALVGRRGAIVAIDPKSGEVLVFVSTPAFDPNAFSAGLSRSAYNALQEDIDKPLFNRALRGTYPPGSTIKPIVALAGMAYGIIGPKDSVYCGGSFSLPGSSHRYRDWRPEGHGMVDMQSGIEQSCDVYFYNLARNLGIQRMGDFLRTFGLGEPTGIEMPGENSGLVPSPAWKQRAFSSRANQVWFPGETVIAGIGQGYMLATPLQLAHAAATIASHGRRLRPSMLHALRDPITSELKPATHTVTGTVGVADAGQWDTITAAMHGVMHGDRGTARAVGRGAPLQMAGKSGTAQVFTVAQTAKYNAAEVAERRRDHALFIAYAPLDDPQIAVAVVVENGESGSKVAAPIARRVMEAYLRVGGA